MEKKKKTKIVFKVLKRILTLKRVAFIIILLIANTFAWFIYAKQVSNNINVHVRSWKILFTDGNSTIEDYAYVNVDSVYPGMDKYTDDIKAYNMGEVNATVTYKILSARILNETYYSTEYYEENQTSAPEGTMTSAQLEDYFVDTYPFKIAFDISSEKIDAEVGETTYSINVIWPYESGDDALDTYWGTKAYDFIKANPNESCISMKVKIFIAQSN